MQAAASARLCVETAIKFNLIFINLAAASARLCVETGKNFVKDYKRMAAASARLCVETSSSGDGKGNGVQPPPRGCVLKHCLCINQHYYLDAAASARLCVETSHRQLPG